MTNHVTADLPAEEYPQLCAPDRLIVGDGSEHLHLQLRPGSCAIAKTDGCGDRYGKAFARAVLQAARDRDELIGTTRELGPDVVDQEVEIAVGPDDAREGLAADLSPGS